MQTRHNRRTPLLVIGLLPILIASSWWLTWREFRQQNLNKELIAAVERADAKTTVELLDLGADPNTYGAARSETSFWRLILDRVRRVVMRTKTGTPALLLAVNVPCEGSNVSSQSRQASVRIITALLDHGADVRLTDSDGFDVVYDSILCACDDQSLRLLIERHADVNLISSADGRTPLMNAAGWGTPGEISLLLDAGARINDRDANGSTALAYAVTESQDDNIVALLARNADMRITDKTGASPLSVAQSGLAANTTTPNNHGEERETWSHIVRLLVEAGKQMEADQPRSIHQSANAASSD